MSHLLRNAITRWVLLVHRHARLTLWLTGLCSLAAGVAAVHLFSLDSDVGKLIRPGPDNRWHAQQEAYKAAFPQFQDAAIVVLSGSERKQVDAATDSLLVVLRESGWYHRAIAPARNDFLAEHSLYRLESRQISSLGEQVQELMPLARQLNADPGLTGFFDLLRQLLLQDELDGGRSDATEGLLEKLESALSAPGRAVNWLPTSAAADKENHYQLILLAGKQQFNEKAPSKAVIAATRNSIAAVAPQFPEVSIRLTGELAMADEELQVALQGIQFAGALSLILLGLVLAVGVRSWSISLVIFSLLGAGIAWTTLYACLAVGSFNTLSLVFLVMFFGLGVDFALHYSLRVEESLGRENEAATPLASATDDIGTALLLCTVTSGLAFLGFYPTEYRGLAELGVISAGGMLIAFVLTLTLIPAWFSVFGMPQRWRGSKKLHFGLDRLNPLAVLTATGIVAAGAFWFAKDARFDYSVLAMRDKTSEAMATLLELQREGIGTNYTISVLAPPQEATELAVKLSALPEVANVTTPQDLIPGDQNRTAALLAPLASAFDMTLSLPLPWDARAAERAQQQLLATLPRITSIYDLQDVSLVSSVASKLAELSSEADRKQLQQDLLTSLFSQLQLLQAQLRAQPFTLESLPPELRSRLIASDGNHLLSVLPAEQLDSLDAMDRFVSSVESVAPNIAGRTVVERGIGQVVVRSFHTAVVLALSGIMIVLLLYFREPLTPLLILIPLALTCLFTFALIELTGLTINMANILVVPLIFGLGVDTGIHVVHRYHGAKNIGELLQSSTPRAVTLSALTTVGTFFSLAFSPHQGAASIGLILSVAITLLVVVTFVVLPALLAVFEPLRRDVS